MACRDIASCPALITRVLHKLPTIRAVAVQGDQHMQRLSRVMPLRFDQHIALLRTVDMRNEFDIDRFIRL